MLKFQNNGKEIIKNKVMIKYIDKDALVAEIERKLEALAKTSTDNDRQFAAIIGARHYELESLARYINNLEVTDPYEQCIQYQSIEDGIKAFAEIYSFNIDSELFNQLTKEQQKLWRKEINQACISGGHVGVELARDTRYKENFEVKDVDLENDNNNPKITVGTKIRSKTNPDIILSIISNDCHEDEFECSNGSVLSLKQIEKYYDII